MSDRFINRDSNGTERALPTDPFDQEGWERGGGATLEGSSVMTAFASAPVREEALVREEAPVTDGTTNALDDRQDKVMTIISSEGRPPSHWQRMREWRWFGMGAILVIVGITVWIAVEGVSWGTLGVGLAVVVLLLVSATPVLGAGLLRGKEERAARRIARFERRGSRDR